MNLKEKLINQCRRPKGFLGKIIAKGMNKGHSEMANWAMDFIPISPEDHILDIGCGGGQNMFNFAKMLDGGKIYGIDYSEVSIQLSKKLNKEYISSGIAEVQHASVASLPFNNERFDLVTGFETYYFWPKLIENMKEINRVLKKEGKFILVNEVFKCKNEKLRKRNEKWANLGNFPIHVPQEVGEFMKCAGFSEVQIIIQNEEKYFAVLGTK